MIKIYESSRPLLVGNDYTVKIFHKIANLKDAFPLLSWNSDAFPFYQYCLLKITKILVERPNFRLF